VQHIDTEVFVMKTGAAVDDQDAVVLLDGQAIHANFAEPAQRDQANTL
jgi:hypothetical protein